MHAQIKEMRGRGALRALAGLDEGHGLREPESTVPGVCRSQGDSVAPLLKPRRRVVAGLTSFLPREDSP